MHWEIFNKTKKQKIVVDKLKDFGISKLDYLLIKTGKDKIRGFSGSLSVEEINKLNKIVNIESIGTKLINLKDKAIRINFDAISIPEINKQINKNVIEINDKELDKWLHGQNLELKEKINSNFAVLKHDNDFVGMGKIAGKTLLNYVPKERRLRG